MESDTTPNIQSSAKMSDHLLSKQDNFSNVRNNLLVKYYQHLACWYYLLQ